ncbi:uncharacterized protein LOC144124040 [Amblyomma americanum]
MAGDVFVARVNSNKGRQHKDIRLPFLKSKPSTTQFFVALASELCARTNASTAQTLNTDYGVKTAEQRLNILASHMQKFTDHFKCGPKSRMRVKRGYSNCLFWKPTSYS